MSKGGTRYAKGSGGDGAVPGPSPRLIMAAVALGLIVGAIVAPDDAPHIDGAQDIDVVEKTPGHPFLEQQTG